MMLPVLMGLANKATGRGGIMSMLTGGTASGGKRRRRRGLTPAQKADLLFIRDAVGKTAAANYLNLIRRF